MDLAKLVELGGKMGLAGSELQAFIREELEAARAEHQRGGIGEGDTPGRCR